MNVFAQADQVEIKSANPPRAVIQRKPLENRRKMGAVEGELIRPQRMRTHRTFVEASHLQHREWWHESSWPARANDKI
jgi:hypothetical protein